MTNSFRPVQSSDTNLPAGYASAPWGRYFPGSLQRLLIALARKTPLHRGKMRYRMTQAVARLGSPLDVEFRGCRYRIEGRNNLMEYGLLLHPRYNAEEIDFLSGAVPEGGVFVDIGANIGLYSLPLATAAGASGRVIAIDANAAILARLAVNVAATGLSNVTVVHTAVGAYSGQVDLTIRGDDLSIVRVTEASTGGIPMRPLAEILAEQGVTHVDALKIDIEGHEDAALVPYFADVSGDMLPRRISIERGGPDGGDYVGCAAAFARHGYRLVGRTRSNSLYER